MVRGLCFGCGREIAYVYDDDGVTRPVERAPVVGRPAAGGRACVTATGRWVWLEELGPGDGAHAIGAYAMHDCPGERGGQA
jgi:hypothetical protein